jgi:L-ascorbate metabolism protein UlaG (beta-lactamase superfamily)
MVGFKYSQVEADIVTVSHDHKDHNMASVVAGAKKVVEGPGEYEIMGVTILGYASFHDEEKGAKRGKNTIYVIEAEGLRIAHLGDLGHPLSDELTDTIGAIDILMLPVGGELTIGPKEAATVASKIDPYFVIAMHFATSGINPEVFGKLEPVDNFVKELGMTVENLPKFVIKKEDIIEDQTSKVILLEKK